MAKKIYVLGSNLLIEDTATGVLEFDVPKYDYYYDWRTLDEKNKIKIVDANSSNYQTSQYYITDLTNSVDETLTPFTKESFQIFARTNLRQ